MENRIAVAYFERPYSCKECPMFNFLRSYTEVDCSGHFIDIIHGRCKLNDFVVTHVNCIHPDCPLKFVSEVPTLDELNFHREAEGLLLHEIERNNNLEIERFDELLIIESEHKLRKEIIEEVHEDILEQKKDGVIVLPMGFRAVIAPGNVDIRFEQKEDENNA